MSAFSSRSICRILAGCLAALAAAGCEPTISTHGHQIDPTVLAQIEPGTTSREEVTRLIGSPSTTGTFDGESWFYVSQRNETTSFYQADVTQQDVVRVDFDANGIVKDVRNHGLELAQAVTPDPNRTRTLGNELTVVQQFIGNIGRFNSTPELRPESPAGR
jgi:outer membrane protein assembly factor BamE (lipoprotein component of BamABCDE complex)